MSAGLSHSQSCPSIPVLLSHYPSILISIALFSLYTPLPIAPQEIPQCVRSSQSNQNHSYGFSFPCLNLFLFPHIGAGFSCHSVVSRLYDMSNSSLYISNQVMLLCYNTSTTVSESKERRPQVVANCRC